jgi:thiol:disulfide interchange protein DsbG
MKKVFLAAALAALTSSAFAAPDAVPKVLNDALLKGMQIVTKFDAANNLQGWVVKRGGNTSVVYTSQDGKFLISGALVDETGKNLTLQYAEKYIPKPDYAKLYTQLETSAYFTEGAQGAAVKSVIYAFLDPNCVFCHFAWKALQPYEKVGLQVRWVPVGFLKPDSGAKAAALLEASDPAAAMAKNETEFVRNTESGGVKPVERISEATAKKLAANAKLMNDFGFGGTPAIIYKDKTGKVAVKPGMPRMSELPGMTGLPEQPENDPDLARFK